MILTTILGFLFLQFMSVNAQEKQSSDANSSKGESIYELRIYYPHEGKLEGILSRFRNHTTALFEKHGFTNVGYWVTRPGGEPSFADVMMAQNGGKEALLYIVSFPDMETRNAAWQAFVKDPEWIKVYEESRVNGPLVREIEQVYLNPTDFSGLK
jgi:hypothetical protein